MKFEPVNSNYHDDRCLCFVCRGLEQDDYEYLQEQATFKVGDKVEFIRNTEIKGKVIEVVENTYQLKVGRYSVGLVPGDCIQKIKKVKPSK